MDQIRSWLYIGNYQETRDVTLLQSNGISAILQLAERVDHQGIDSYYLAVQDGKAIPLRHLEQGITYILAQQEQGHTVLVACGLGISRATTFAIAALKELEDKPLLELYRDIKRCRPAAMPMPALWQTLCQYYHESVPWAELLRKI
ncbi:MAG: dual specificity protein phosphatase family protein [Caldilineaceae bacterium]|nr:dual specificity protein phosphatase family protein [Caldilineaceae bacterium]